MIKWIYVNIKEGRDSGYNWFDISWFFIRYPFLDYIFGYKYVDEKGNLVKEVRIRMPWLRSIDDVLTRRYQHVVSPLTYLYHRVFKVKVKYYDCPKCDWRQFRVKKCKRC